MNIPNPCSSGAVIGVLMVGGVSASASAGVIQLQASSSASASARAGDNSSSFDTANGTDLNTYMRIDSSGFGDNWGRTSSSATELKLEIWWDGDGSKGVEWDRSGATMAAVFTVDEAVEVDITRDWTVLSDGWGMYYTSFSVTNVDTGDTVVEVLGATDGTERVGTTSIVLLAGVNYRFDAQFGNNGSAEFRDRNGGLATTTFTVTGAASIGGAVPGPAAAMSLAGIAAAGRRRRRS